MSDLTNCKRRLNVDIIMLYISANGSCQEVTIQQLCSSATRKQNNSISLPLSDSVQCRVRLLFSIMGAIFQLWNI